MPKVTQQAGSVETVVKTPQRPGAPRFTSPYFRDPTRSPYFENVTKKSISAGTRIRRVETVEAASKGVDSSPRASSTLVSATVIDQPKGGDASHRRKRKKRDELVVQRPKLPSTTSMKELKLVLRNTHCDRSVPMIVRLLHTKPRLVQGFLFHKPWWLLIAVILLNKTTGKAATPVLYKIMSRWPDMEALSRACVPELQELLTPLGLAAVRTQRLILFANMYLQDPPSQSHLRPSRVQVAKGEPKYPPTAISHLPGMGKYALDSYRIFCCEAVGVDDWKTVMPLDKELRVYVRWRWAILGQVWDCQRGVVGPVTEQYLNDLCEGTLSPYCTAPAYISTKR
ncbi:hypothetical protein M408DRAFT_331611 [Serendipita vermifera MAFF 305830]|uniref:HhH-GPD domain-containing protein n=1 Tax=Serendipita vermifera MAFF 305830 TaxID=933852 RepID=A0A0C2WEB5_SERVB|nr:hypothetical protein M408DRAFT_331611 [Serendipita vermifera MAFF 305830]